MTDPAPSPPAARAPSPFVQLLGSLLGAVILVAVVVAVVSTRLPAEGVGDRRDREDRAEEAAEEAAEAREEEADGPGRRRRGRDRRD